MVSGILAYKFGPAFAWITSLSVGAYIAFTLAVTQVPSFFGILFSLPTMMQYLRFYHDNPALTVIICFRHHHTLFLNSLLSFPDRICINSLHGLKNHSSCDRCEVLVERWLSLYILFVFHFLVINLFGVRCRAHVAFIYPVANQV